jgi:hypothetical protein
VLLELLPDNLGLLAVVGVDLADGHLPDGDFAHLACDRLALQLLPVESLEENEHANNAQEHAWRNVRRKATEVDQARVLRGTHD